MVLLVGFSLTALTLVVWKRPHHFAIWCGHRLSFGVNFFLGLRLLGLSEWWLYCEMEWVLASTLHFVENIWNFNNIGCMRATIYIDLCCWFIFNISKILKSYFWLPVNCLANVCIDVLGSSLTSLKFYFFFVS